MAKELFIEKLHEASARDVPLETREGAENALNKAVTVEEQLAGLSNLLAIYFAERDYLSAFFIIDKFLDNPRMTDQRAYLLFQKGQASECLHEFDDALIYYCRGLASHIVPQETYFALWDGVSLCLLYKQDFKQAEHCCRKVLELDAKQWKAWKNLGVSLEYQGSFSESLKAYMKAINLSKGNKIAALHLWRFRQRHSNFC